jgi:hypothetical protein
VTRGQGWALAIVASVLAWVLIIVGIVTLIRWL